MSEYWTTSSTYDGMDDDPPCFNYEQVNPNGEIITLTDMYTGEPCTINNNSIPCEPDESETP